MKNRGTSGAKKQSAHRVALSALCFFIVLGAGWMIGPAVLSSPPPESRYMGVVQLPRDRQNRCQEFELDNRSATLTPRGFRECPGSSGTDVAPQTGGSPTPQTTGGSVGRINGIASHFKSR